MPRPSDPTARERILDAAQRLFYERGVQAVGIAEVVEEAGTGRNVLYRHFPSKDDLVLAYLRRMADRLDETAAEALADRDGVEGLRALAVLVRDRVMARGYRGCPFRNYIWEMRDTRGPAGRFALAQVRALRRQVEEFAPDPAVAERVWLQLEGVYAGAHYPERRQMATALVDLCDGLEE